MVGTRDIASFTRGRHRGHWGIGVATLLVLSACGDGSSPDTETGLPDDFEATPAYLTMVADQSTAEAYRYEAWSTYGDDATPQLAGTAPISGAVDGDAFSMDMDLAALTRAAAADSPVPGMPDELQSSLLYVGDDRLWTNVGYLQDLPEDELFPVDQTIRDLIVGTDGWVVYDFSEMPDFSYEQHGSGLSPFGAADPVDIVDLLTQADNTTELGTQDVRGKAMSGIGASVTIGDLMERDGIEPVEWAGDAASIPDADFPPDVDPDDARLFLATVLTALTHAVVPLEAWVDQDGYVGQMAITFDLAEATNIAIDRGIEAAPSIAEQVEESGTPAYAAPATTLTIQAFDYGDESIDIQPPDDAVDLSDRPDLLGQGLNDQWDADQFTPWTPDEHLAHEDFQFEDFEYEDFGYEDFEIDDIEYGEYHNLDDFLAEADDLLTESEDLVVESEDLMTETDDILAESEALMDDIPARHGLTPPLLPR